MEDLNAPTPEDAQSEFLQKHGWLSAGGAHNKPMAPSFLSLQPSGIRLISSISFFHFSNGKSSATRLALLF